MTFTDAADVRAVVEQMRLVDVDGRSENRARINSLANGDPPFTKEEELENNIEINASDLVVARAIHDGRKTWNNAFLKAGQYFRIVADYKHRKKDTWARQVTDRISKIMKRSLAYTEKIRATGAQVILHGIGPGAWEDRWRWRSEEIGIEDLLIPSGTWVNCSNLNHFAIYRKYTAGQLYRKTHGKYVDPGWNMEMVEEQLKTIIGQFYGMLDYQQMLNPEKIVEFYKTQGGILDTDVVPTINCWDFYWQSDREEEEQWNRAIVLDMGTSEGQKFLYKSKKPVANSWRNLLTLQFGDGANKAPFLYHAVRGMGFLLYAPGHLNNRLWLRMNGAIFENSVMGVRINNAEDRARIQKIDLFHNGLMVVPNGVEIIPENERRSINQELMMAGLSQNRQLIAESASQFVQDIDTGTQKEMTAHEVMARMNASNAIVAGMLTMALEYATFEYIEICRRFCQKGSRDPDVRQFREQILADGVPEDFLDVDHWEIQPERVLGSGNKILEMAQARGLLEVRPILDPEPQRRVTRIYVEALTDDADLALELVPEVPHSTQSKTFGQMAAGALMQGLPAEPPRGANHMEYVGALLTAMGAVIDQIEATGKVATKEQVIGLVSLTKAIQSELALIAQDDTSKDKVRELAGVLSKMTQKVKEYAAILDKQMESGQSNGQNGEAQGKIAATVIQAQVKAKTAEASAEQKRRHKDLAFAGEQRRRDIETQLEARRNLVKTQAEVQGTDLKTAADIRSSRAKEAAGPEEE